MPLNSLFGFSPGEERFEYTTAEAYYEILQCMDDLPLVLK